MTGIISSIKGREWGHDIEASMATTIVVKANKKSNYGHHQNQKKGAKDDDQQKIRMGTANRLVEAEM
jgi:hypothetical protein